MIVVICNSLQVQYLHAPVLQISADQYHIISDWVHSRQPRLQSRVILQLREI